MSTEDDNNPLATTGDVGMTKEQEDALLKDDSLGYITMMHGVSEAVVRNTPKGVRAGDFVLSGRILVPSGMNGPGFVCHVGPTRPRAVYFEGREAKKSSYDPKSTTWLEIAALVAGRTQGAKVGFEFMLWLPDFDFIGALHVANRDRFDAGQKLLNFSKEKKLARVSTTLKGAKNSVVLTVEEGPRDPIALPEKERYELCLAAFEAYKKERAAPPRQNAR